MIVSSKLMTRDGGEKKTSNEKTYMHRRGRSSAKTDLCGSSATMIVLSIGR
jgi:hypothetical protein